MQVARRAHSVNRYFSRVTVCSAAFLMSLALAASSAFAGAPAGPSGVSTSTTHAENTTAQSIQDLNTTTSTITVSGLDGYLWDVDLTTPITHASCQDLTITLTSPQGTVVTITANNGGGYADVFDGTLWDDDAGDTNAPGPVTDTAFEDGVTETPLCPEEAFGAFIGQNPNGVWTLEVSDNAAGNTGSLNGWSLDLTTLPRRPYDSPCMQDTGISGQIPDGGTKTVSTGIGGRGSFVRDVQIMITVKHTRCEDLDITLTSPEGTTVTITTDNGGDHNNVFDGTVWEDCAGRESTAPGPVTQSSFTDGVAVAYLCPEEAFAAFIGENPNGNWTLSITDDQAGETGSFNSWVIRITTCYYPDSDGDGVLDMYDVCNGFDDNADADGDGVPDGCDLCPGFDDADDADSDGVPNGCDQCPGADDTVDTDSDGVPDCLDNCPNDINKVEPGACGCGENDTDTDGDGVADCNDECPNDINKIEPGACGCGELDTDTDGDGVADCNDECPDDPNKIAPGFCDCGMPDDDLNDDGLPDCYDIDLCPDDPYKRLPGICGCGVPDEDLNNDGVPDCLDIDLCPDDPDKTLPGACGCGVPDTDTDGDGIPDCYDTDAPDGQENPDDNNGDAGPFAFCGVGTAACLPLMAAGLGLMHHRFRRRRR